LKALFTGHFDRLCSARKSSHISDLPEVGLKTGFANNSTFRIPFTLKSRERDKPVAEGIATLKLTRRADTPSVTVNKVSIEQLREDPAARNRSCQREK
jgi:hypothetical protein